MGHVLGPQPGEVVVDLCSAPGGKTSHLASLMNNQGLVVAIDRRYNAIHYDTVVVVVVVVALG